MAEEQRAQRSFVFQRHCVLSGNPCVPCGKIISRKECKGAKSATKYMICVSLWQSLCSLCLNYELLPYRIIPVFKNKVSNSSDNCLEDVNKQISQRNILEKNDFYSYCLLT
jgi:hypothetical protein